STAAVLANHSSDVLSAIAGLQRFSLEVSTRRWTRRGGSLCPSSSSLLQVHQQDDEAYQKGWRDGQVRCPLRCDPEEVHQEDGNHSARYLHLHLLRQGLRQAHRCRHLALQGLQEDDRRWRVDRLDHGCCDRPQHCPSSPRARRGLSLPIGPPVWLFLERERRRAVRLSASKALAVTADCSEL
ncbi:hypothetical protein RTBOTA2_000067, partial [Rhodotorula toruloides]